MRGQKYQLGRAQLGRWKTAWREKTLFYNGAAIIVALGIAFPVSVLQRVKAISDSTPPTLAGASITSGAVMDTVNTMYPGYNETMVDLHVNDNLSGNTTPFIVYTSPSGKQTATGGSLNALSDVEWPAYADFPQFSEAGVWTPTVYLQDVSGNKSAVTDAQLHAMGINIDVTLTGQGDTTNPVLTSIERTNPGVLDVTGYSPAASTLIHMTDNMSGFGIPTLTYTSPSGNQVTSDYTCNPVDGNTANVGTYDCEVYFSQYAESGTWTPNLIITDGAANTVHYSNANLLAMGVDDRVAITGTSDTTAPVVGDVNITFANPPADNIPYGGAVITVSGTVSDNLSGLTGQSKVRYTSPSGTVVEGDITTDGSGGFTSNVSLPQYTEGGTWQPSVYVRDVAGNQHTYTATELANMGANIAVTVGKNITETAAPGGTVTSDYEGDGATAANPIEASVTTPSGGPVSIVIVQSDNISDNTNGYTFFDRQISISAPHESAATPLTLSFMIDSSEVPAGESASTLAITRNGSVVPACSDQSTAAPDPCVFSRQTLAGGDIKIQIHSTTASAWASGFPSHTFTFKGFVKPTKDYPKVNDAQAGQVLPISFKVKGVPHGVTNILAVGQPTTQRVNCNNLNLMGAPQVAVSAENAGLDRDGKIFTYDWKTTKSWKGTCRVFTVQLTDGSSKQALFDF